jgi:hypothetical protein
MNRWRVGEDRGSKETDGCPLTKMIALLGIPWHLTKGQEFSFQVENIGFLWDIASQLVPLTNLKHERFKDRVDEFLPFVYTFG